MTPGASARLVFTALSVLQLSIAIPILLILNHFVGLYGVVAAQLISDGCTFIFSTLIYRRVYNSLQKELTA